MYKLIAILFAVANFIIPQLACAQSKVRFPALDAAQLSPEQKQWADMIAAPPRNANFKSPPYNIYIRNPELAERMIALNDYLRNTKLPVRITQLAILITARQWNSHYVWRAHYRRTIKGGLDPTVLADMAAGKRPEKLKDDEAALYNFAMEIYRNREVSDATYEKAITQFGERGVYELVAIMGYYNITSMILITANVATPKDDEVPPLQVIAK